MTDNLLEDVYSLLTKMSDSQFANVASGEFCDDLKAMIEGAISQASDRIKGQAAEIERLQKEVERRSYNGIHTCHDDCQRVACRQRREIAQLISVVDALLQHDTSTFWGPDSDKNKRASYRGVIRKAKKVRIALGDAI
jgi:hypothetical protein